MRQAEIREWFLFLGATTGSEAADELQRLVTRLDEAYDIVNGVLKRVSGAPGGEVDETLLVSRSTLTEAVQLLDAARRRMGFGDPEAA